MSGAIPKRFILLSPCGWGNLGDAAIQDAVISAIRQRVTNPQIIGATLNPDDTTKRHGIPAQTINGFSITPGYTNQEPPLAARPLPAHHKASTPPEVRSSIKPGGIIGLIKKITWPIRRPIYPLIQEIRHIRKSYRLVKSADMLLASGGGQLDEYWGGSWGHPYALCKWSWLARRANIPFAIVGVGTGSVQKFMSRRFISRALKSARLRSFRDLGSRDLVGFASCTKNDPIVPDLAFGLDITGYHSLSASESPSLHIGVSPIAYLDPRIWPDKNDRAYQAHITVMTETVAGLVAAGHRVSLFSTDPADEPCVKDLLSAMANLGDNAAVDAPTIKTVPELMTLLSQLDMVIASRLHGVILACLMKRPTLAISYERKVETLMKDLQLADYCCQIDTLEKTSLLALAAGLANDRPQVVRQLTSAVQAYRSTIDTHFDTLMASIPERP
jgi:polysaccharide pyruvyl transferase WcaK-like protein